MSEPANSAIPSSEPRPSPAGSAIMESLFAAFLGGVPCLLAFVILNGLVSKLLPSLTGFVDLEAICAVPCVFVGWLLFLLPVALSYNRQRFFQRTVPMCLAGGIFGALLMGLQCAYFLRGFEPLMFAVFVPFGILDAVVATAALMAMRRRSARKLSEGA